MHPENLEHVRNNTRAYWSRCFQNKPKDLGVLYALALFPKAGFKAEVTGEASGLGLRRLKPLKSEQGPLSDGALFNEGDGT